MQKNKLLFCICKKCLKNYYRLKKCIFYKFVEQSVHQLRSFKMKKKMQDLLQDQGFVYQDLLFFVHENTQGQKHLARTTGLVVIHYKPIINPN